MGMTVLPITDADPERYRQVLEAHEILVEVTETEHGHRLVCRRLGSRRAFGFYISNQISFVYANRTEGSCGTDLRPAIRGTMAMGPGWDEEHAYLEPHVCNLLYEAGLLLLSRPFKVAELPTCPECGRPLRVRLAKQCLACGADWRQTT